MLRLGSRIALAFCAFAVLLNVAEGITRRLRRKPNAVASLTAEQVNKRESTRRIEVRKSATDKRRYVHANFDTGLRVLTVTDPEAEKAAFAVAVSAGSLEDPESFQGLAHFCEHMLFLGSEKYPDQDTFTKHLATFGGNHNAYTSAESTVYFNEINTAGLEKGLDIFAQFFISPSFNRSMVDKEIHAVDSEHQKNMPDVTRKLWHLLQSRASKENPWHKFSTGDLETLKTDPEKEGKDLVSALEKFHNENYCSKRLHLVMVGKQSAEEQLELAHKAFDAVPRNDACQPRPVYTSPAFSKELKNVGDRLTLHTQGTGELWLQFPTLPPLHKEYKAQPAAYLLHALGHYGEGGLKEALLKEDLSHSYSPMMDSNVAGSAMLVRFMLTEKGRQNPDRVMELFFSYLNAVRKEGVVDEKMAALQQWRHVSFDYQPEATTQFQLVESLGGAVSQEYAPEDLLTGGYLIDKPDKHVTQEVMEAIDPRRMNVALVDPKFDEANANEKEHYYQTAYKKEALGEELMARLEKASEKTMAPAPKLRYVPTNLELVKEGSGKAPKLLLEKGRVAVWWQGMNAVQLPKGDAQLKLGFPQVLTKSIEGGLLAGIHSRIVSQLLEGPTDEMQMCGLSYGVSSYEDGIGVSFTGFDQHMESMMAIVLPVVREPKFTDEQFESVRRQTLLDLQDLSRQEPYHHAMEAFDLVTVKDSFARKELVAAAMDSEKVSPATYRAFLAKLFEKTELTMLFSGNIGEKRARSMALVAEEKLQVTDKQSSLDLTSESAGILKPDGTVEARIPNPIAGDPNSATLVAYQVGIPTIEERVRLQLLGDIIGDPVFDTLRTKHQLGYVVFGYATLHKSVAEVRVLVQGFRKDPDAVEPLVESTVHNITQVLKSMSSDEFVQRKKNVKLALTKPEKTLGQEVSKSWSPIWQKHQCFDKKEKMLAKLDAMGDSTEPLVKMWEKATTPGPDRKKVVVKLFGGNNGATTANATHPKMAGLSVVTLLDSADLKNQFAGASYWDGHKMLCE